MTFAISENKYSYFLITILGSVIILSLPLIYGHFFHSGHLLHVAIHEIGFILASFLTVMTLISYKKTKITRMIFSAGAFLVLGISQIGFMLEKIDTPAGMQIENVAEEHFDIGILIMTVLFALGIFWKR